MKSDRAHVRVRRAFLYYTLKRLGLDGEMAGRRPQDQQIILLNPQVLAPEPIPAEAEG